MQRTTFYTLTLLAVLAFVSPFGCERDRSAQNLAAYENLWDEIVNEGKLELINTDNFTDDVVIVQPSENLRGVEDFRAHYRHFIDGFSDVAFTVEDAFADGDRVVKHWRFRGTHTGDFFGIPATGREVDLAGVTLATLRDGKIAREQDFFDNAVFMRQLGIASDPANLAVIDGIYRAFGEGDMPAVLGAMAADIEWNEAEGNALADGNPYVGPDAVLNGVFARIGAEHDYFKVKDIELHEMSGNRVLATLRYEAKRKRSGKLIDAQAAHLWTLSDGKVTAFQQYVDTKQLATAAAK